MKKLIAIFLSLTLVSSIPVPIFANQEQYGKKLDKLQITEKLNNLSNGKLKLSEKDGQVFLSGKLSNNQTAGEKSAIKFLDENKPLFGIGSTADDLKTVEVKKDKTGDTYVKFVQVINGVKVKGSLINVHFDKNGAIVSVNGKLGENKSITTLGSEAISESNAVEIAKKQYTYKNLRNIPEAEKLILTKDNKNYEVFKVNISYTEPTIGNYDVFIEAHSGKVIQVENNIRFDGATAGTGIDVLGNVKNLNLYLSSGSYQMKDVTKSAASSIVTYSLNHGNSYSGPVSNSTNYFSSEDQKASVSANYNAGKVIDFYKNLFNRNSLDDKGMTINSFTNYGNYYNNAFWDGYEMVYGDGDGTTFTYLSGDLSVVGHEMTHGVIDNTAALQYHNQSGALNESIADVFGVLISTYDKYNVSTGGNWMFNTADWVIGNDIYTPYISGDALRSLSNPALYGQPDKMSAYKNSPDTGTGDWGGVHTNSGIPNKAAYLIAKNVGMEKTAKIYYRALLNYMSTDTDFVGARNSLGQAAADLYGDSSAEVTAVNNAFNDVEVQQPIVDVAKLVTGVSLDRNIASLKAGEAITLSAVVNPSDATNKNVTWKSSNSSVAVVDSTGKVTATGNGTAAITVTTMDGGYTATCIVTGIDVTVPASVNAISSSYNSIYISWRTVAGASGYEVYRATSSTGTYSLISTTTAAGYNNTGLATNRMYYYKVRAFRLLGASKVYGGFSISVGSRPIPSSPSNLRATRITSRSIKLTWSGVTGGSGYEVYRATSSTGTYSLLKRTTSRYYINSGLARNKTYYYKIRTYRTLGKTKVYSNWTTVVYART